MGLSETILFYLLIGLGVSIAVWNAGANNPHQRLFRTLSAVPFWPLYLPILLTPEQKNEPRHVPTPIPLTDELSVKIAEVERELDAALSSLDDWAEGALSREHGRITDLRSAWNVQAARIREMDLLLAHSSSSTQVGGDEGHENALVQRSERARRDNFARLLQVRDQAYRELTTTLVRVRELVSLIHLAKFTGAPASSAEQLVMEIAASVEGLSEVAAWRDSLPSHCESCSVQS